MPLRVTDAYLRCRRHAAREAGEQASGVARRRVIASRQDFRRHASPAIRRRRRAMILSLRRRRP